MRITPNCAKALNRPLQAQQEAPRHCVQSSAVDAQPGWPGSGRTSHPAGAAVSSSDFVKHKVCRLADHEELFDENLDLLGRLLGDRTSRAGRPGRQ